ncbi:ABC transporter permease [Aquabacter spiritensis]|uniref:ABC transporter permease n=1 Tax=Aquabacter spiritensis TaxID=933073 RepID=UPI00140548C3|nr:ABC transporter permease [Aquabacter spiritensis]
MLPALLVFAVIFAWPVISFVAAGARALVDSDTGLADIVGGHSMLTRYGVASLVLAFTTTFITLILGYPVAYYLARSRSRLRYYVYVGMFVPLLFSIVVRTFGWIILLGSNGVLNGVLRGLGIIQEPVVWLYNFWAAVAGLVHVFLPFMVLSILSSLSRIDERIEEAATILGANGLRVFSYVTLPLSAPGVFGGCAIVFSLSMGVYVTPRLLGGGRVQVLATEIYSQMLELGDWSAAATLGIVLMILTFSVVAIYRLLLPSRIAGR